jgi:hypothetical protein
MPISQGVLHLVSVEKALNQSSSALSFVLLRIDEIRLALNNDSTANQRKGSTYAFSKKHSAATRQLNW